MALYLIALIYDYVSSDSIIKTTVKCKYCRKWISDKVSYFLLLSLRGCPLGLTTVRRNAVCTARVGKMAGRTAERE
jgi:hypothetical protein